jgi:DUF1680 family protein
MDKKVSGPDRFRVMQGFDGAEPVEDYTTIRKSATRLRTSRSLQASIPRFTQKALPFMTGDFYKTLEAVASMYAVTKDPKLDEMMD